MEKIVVYDEKSAVEYARHVLTEWKSFCDTHQNIAKALEILLEMSERSKASEVAREIFAKIQEKFKELTQDGKMSLFQALVSAVNTIEKKYTEEGK